MTDTKERPILFSAPMIRALLDGSKTQTRRVVKGDLGDETRLHVGMYHPTITDRHGDEHPGPEVFGAWTTDGQWAMKCPYGQPGDRLWVRETWQAVNGNDRARHIVTHPAPDPGWIEYAATPRIDEPAPKWRPSIHMPRWASRITLEVTVSTASFDGFEGSSLLNLHGTAPTVKTSALLLLDSPNQE